MTNDEFLELIANVPVEDVNDALASLPEHLAEMILPSLEAQTRIIPESPLAEAQSLDDKYRVREHLTYLSDRLSQAVTDVENGMDRKLTVSMPPRLGKSHMASTYFPLWLLHKHPDWKIGLISHSPALAASWGRAVRRMVEEHGDVLGIEVAHDAGKVTDWQTTQGGGILSRSAPGQSVTGYGFKVLLIDDPVKNFATAHSENSRNALWQWWTGDAYTRLEPPSLTAVIGTRWHEDDMIGRLRSKDHEGNPDDWEVISFPAIAQDNDVLGRDPGDPLLSPIVDETSEEADERWDDIRSSVGEYAWSALYMQEPSPSKGAIFETDSFRYWTSDPDLLLEADDGKVVLLNPEELHGARWIDSWDATFKATDSSDYVVGQRWAVRGQDRFLIAQSRARRSFTSTIAELEAWEKDTMVGSKWVYEKLIEDKANGPAIIDTLKDRVKGIKPVTPVSSKESRARAVTPEIEAGHVYLPHPDQPGNEWVRDLVSECRQFPNGAHDDQVDGLTQLLNYVRSSGSASISVPGRGRTGGLAGASVPKRGSVNSRRTGR